MGLNGLDADAEHGCGLLIAITLGDELNHFALARRQLVRVIAQSGLPEKIRELYL